MMLIVPVQTTLTIERFSIIPKPFDFFKHKTFSAVPNSRENRALYSLAAAKNWHMFSSDITQAFTYGKLDVPL